MERSWLRLLAGARTAIAEIKNADQADQYRSKYGEQRTRRQVARRHLGVRRQIVDFGSIDKKEKRVKTAEHFLVSAVQVGAFFTGFMQLLYALAGSLTQLADGAELD
jgi:hypothetical protein